MDDLTDILERADRAVASLPLPPDGFGRLRRYQKRRHRRNRMMVGAAALLVAAGGVGSVALLRAVHPAPPHHPSAKTSTSPSPAPDAFPVGPIAQRSMGGGPAQLLGPFWFGVGEDNSCLSAGPLAIGPSWTFQDGGHDCVQPLGPDPIRVGQARGGVHRDGDLGPTTEFNAVYGMVTHAAARVDLVWSTGEVATVRPIGGRVRVVWSGSAWPVRADVLSADGKTLSAVFLTPP
jgi:hypothetical protein